MEPNVLQLTRRREAIKCNRKAHTRTLKADGRLARVPFVWPLEGQCGGVGQQLPPHPPPHRRTAGPCPNASCLDFQEGSTGTVLSAPSEAGGPGMCCLHLLGAAAAQPVPGLTHRELGVVPEHRPAGRDGSGMGAGQPSPHCSPRGSGREKIQNRKAQICLNALGFCYLQLHLPRSELTPARALS